MNTYIVPFANIKNPDTWIEVTVANNLSEAEDKIMRDFTESWDIDIPTDWQDFKNILAKENIIVGTIEDIEEL